MALFRTCARPHPKNQASPLTFSRLSFSSSTYKFAFDKLSRAECQSRFYLAGLVFQAGSCELHNRWLRFRWDGVALAQECPHL
jgi:hypothetical protein